MMSNPVASSYDKICQPRKQAEVGELCHCDLTMDQIPALTKTDTTRVVEETTVPTPPGLFNDVHFQRWEPASAPCDTEWTPFFRLPPELRRLVWLAYLQRYRMINLDIRAAADEGGDTTRPGDGSQTRYYTDRNTLGNVISGRGYVLSWRDRGGHAAAYSPLLWVNREARHVTLGFYRVQLPFSRLRREQVLLLNTEYDVVSVQFRYTEGGMTSVDALTLLVDLLHDAKAHDSKDQGYVCKYLGGSNQVPARYASSR